MTTCLPAVCRSMFLPLVWKFVFSDVLRLNSLGSFCVRALARLLSFFICSPVLRPEEERRILLVFGSCVPLAVCAHGTSRSYPSACVGQARRVDKGTQTLFLHQMFVSRLLAPERPQTVPNRRPRRRVVGTKVFVEKGDVLLPPPILIVKANGTANSDERWSVPALSSERTFSYCWFS